MDKLQLWHIDEVFESLTTSKHTPAQSADWRGDLGELKSSDAKIMVADGKKSKGSDKEDELLLQDFSRRVSAKSSALFYGNAFIVSSIPIWLYWRIHAIDPASSAIVLALVTIASTWLVAFAYRNTKHVLKHKVAVKRENAVTRDMNKELDSGDKKISRKEKDERILWKKNEVAEYEATTFSIFFNNALFLAILIVCSFYIFRSFSPIVNYVGAMSMAAGIVALLSTGSS